MRPSGSSAMLSVKLTSGRRPSGSGTIVHVSPARRSRSSLVQRVELTAPALEERGDVARRPRPARRASATPPAHAAPGRARSPARTHPAPADRTAFSRPDSGLVRSTSTAGAGAAADLELKRADGAARGPDLVGQALPALDAVLASPGDRRTTSRQAWASTRSTARESPAAHRGEDGVGPAS